MSELFYTLKEESVYEIRIKRSIFICSLSPVENVTEAKAFISKVAAGHRKANHNCWAYIVGEKGEMSHSSDNGEPSGTAGRPMLNALAGRKMIQVSAVVTRYFGGVKLGVRGLINAYGQSVNDTLDLASMVRRIRSHLFQVEVSYSFNDIFLHALNTTGGWVVKSSYQDGVCHTVAVEEAQCPAFEELLAGYGNAGKLRHTSL